MIRRALKWLGGRTAGATRSGKGGSHVHEDGKRRYNKYIRTSHRANLLREAEDDLAYLTDIDPCEGDR